MSILNLSTLACIKRSYDFNDGSNVQWTPDDNSGKTRGMFTVRICIKRDGRIIGVCHHKSGPPSETASLHWLKWALKDHLK